MGRNSIINSAEPNIDLDSNLVEPKLNLDSDLVSLMEHFDSKEDLHISTMPSEIVNACWQFDRGQSV